MGGKGEPNTRLAALLAEAGISRKGLAARVRAEADRVGHKATPDHVSVSRWLAGAKPHADTIRCIAAVLSTKLGRKLSYAELGFDLAESDSPAAPAEVAEDTARYPTQTDEAVDLLADLTSADLAEDSALSASDWVSEPVPSVITEYLFGEPQRLEIATGPLPGLGAEVAERIRSTIRYFMDLDFKFGGGHVRKMLLFYWKTEIIPELRRDYPGPMRREIFRAAADAAEVLGWSAYDAGAHGLAQRYFFQGLRLAREAGDRLMGGQILANLSHQANYLGNVADAIQFARAAQAATIGDASATVQSMFLAMEARALASLGDQRGCAEALHRAERAFERRDPHNDPEWIAYFDALELAGEAAHCFRDLGMASETRQWAGQAIHPADTPPRTRAFIGLVDAAGALSGGDLDEAISVATAAVGQAGSLKSDRYLRYLRDFHTSVTDRHGTHTSVRTFTELIQASHPTLLVRTGATLNSPRRALFASEPRTRPQSPATQSRSA